MSSTGGRHFSDKVHFTFPSSLAVAWEMTASRPTREIILVYDLNPAKVRKPP